MDINLLVLNVGNSRLSIGVFVEAVQFLLWIGIIILVIAVIMWLMRFIRRQT